MQIRLVKKAPTDSSTVDCAFGTLLLEEKLAKRLEAPIAIGPLCIGDWSQASETTIKELLPTASLWIHANQIALDRGRAGENAAAACQLMNERVLDMVAKGWPYAQLAAPFIGNAVTVDPVQAMTVQGLAQGLDGEVLAICVQAGISSLAGTLKGPDGEPVTDPDKQMDLLLLAQGEVRGGFLPLLRSLGSMT